MSPTIRSPPLTPPQLRRQLEAEEEHNDAVLSLLMPPSVLEAAKNLGESSLTYADKFPDASVLFVEICGLFTDNVATASPNRTMFVLNTVFWELDALTEAAGLLKVETVGSVYVVASGMPDPLPDHCARLAVLALDMMDALAKYEDEVGRPLQVGRSPEPLHAPSLCYGAVILSVHFAYTPLFLHSHRRSWASTAAP